ncbi:MAG TPA: hypothetical protein VE988_00565 [Gemmataceae bacterium]|nr:hypothetical protein [Gemmataceae bacterium]
MNQLRKEVVDSLRCKARSGISPSQLLRELISIAPESPDPLWMVQSFAEVFCFTEGQSYPIFGWLPDGTGRLKDSDLDYLLAKRIERNRINWDEFCPLASGTELCGQVVLPKSS